MALSPGTVLQNRYRIAKLVGQGGFGAVYRGWDIALEQPVAVKENFDSGPESQRQFEREAKLLAGLRHPNLPRVGDHFSVPGQGQYLVMDFVEGKSLAVLLAERGGPLSEAEALPWIRQVCGALTYLHQRTPPIIHRDIKPENIIVTNEGRAVLVDFGISKVYDPSKGTTVGAKAVTPGYSPPEQYGRGRTDARSDVYSLGATLYTLLTGHVPPEAPDLSSGADVLTPPRTINPAVREETSRAVLAAMSLSMSQRLGDAGAFQQMLPARVAHVSPPVALPSVGPLPPTQPPVPPPTVPAGAHTDSGKRGVPVWGWLVGVATLIGLAVWAAVAFGGKNGGGETTRQPTAAATSVVAVATSEATPLPTDTATIPASATPSASPAGQVAILSATNGRWKTAEDEGELASNATIPLPSGQRVKLISDSGVVQVALADGTQLFLGTGTEMGLTADATGTAIELDRGRALVHGAGAPVTVGSIVDAWATLPGAGLMGLYLEPSTLLFETVCLEGDCVVAGADDSAPWRLLAGQATVVGSNNLAGVPEPADFAAYAPLAPDLVPQPTATATATPTETPTATATIRPPTRVPTATPQPVVVPAATVPEATATNRPDEPGDPEPTDVPKPPATELPTEPPPPPTTEPTPKPGG